MNSKAVKPGITSLGLTFASVIFSAMSLPATASPTIHSATIQASDNNEQVIVIQGLGFGDKKQAAPVLMDFVDASYEGGLVENSYQLLTDGQKVPVASKGEDSIWATAASGAWGSFPPEVTSAYTPRHEDSTEQYLLVGHTSFLGNPVAYGGESGWDTPTDNKQLYVSWWFKPAYAPQRYWRVYPINIRGSFSKGETLVIGEGIIAEYIGIDEEGMINLVFAEKPPKAEMLAGKIIKGRTSGASSTFPKDHISVSSYGYEAPGSQKYLRVWEDPQGKEGIRFSWTQMHQTIGSVVNWAEAPVVGGSWNHLEFEMDTDEGLIRLKVNSQAFTEFKFDPSLDASGRWSPTAALIGLDGKVGKLQVSQIDDIYFDSTLQRAVIGNAPSLEKVTHYELQMPKKWTDREITLNARKGSLKDIESAYLYIFNSEGIANTQGYPICSDCKLPPEKIGLSVE